MRQRKQAGPSPTLDSLPQLLVELQITAWDLLLVGDGSGTGWNDCCGWACAMIDRYSRDVRPFFGAMSVGSVNVAEFMPYYQALAWFHSQHGQQRLKERGLLRVHIITDSDTTVSHGTQSANPTQPLPKVNRMLWAGMRQLGAEGYHIHYHWARRSTTLLNWYSDLLASLSRRAIKNLPNQPSTAAGLAKRSADAMGHVRVSDPVDGSTIPPHDLTGALYGDSPEASRT